MIPVVTPLAIGAVSAASERFSESGGILVQLALLLLLGLSALAYRRQRLRGTTLVAPWAWSVVSLLAVVSVDCAVALAGSAAPPWVVPLRLAAAMTTFCPLMAVLGAKRPQDRAWQFIVLALWAILSLPSLEWLFFGGVQELHPARFWFLMLLIGAGALNGLATRAWAASLLYCAGQVALLAPHLPGAPDWLGGSGGPPVGLALIVAAEVVRALTARTTRRGFTPLDNAWLDFRDGFGTLWSLRVMERMNASAALVDWPVMLGWQGFFPRHADASVVAVPPAVEESFRTLLRRFVSSEWIDQRKNG